MKRLFLYFLVLTLVSCKKEEKDFLPKYDKAKSDAIIAQEEDLTDTIFFSYNEKIKFDDFALVHLLEKKFGKDSMCTAKFRIDFIQNSKETYSYPLMIKGFNDGSEWFGNFELDSINSPLRSISVGYPACGYSQEDFLFYINKNQSALLFQWTSMSDGGWGSWGEIISGTPENFYYRYISFWEDDDLENDEDIGIAEFSDSIHFEKVNDKWRKEYLTPKDKVYRTKKQTYTGFNEKE